MDFVVLFILQKLCRFAATYLRIITAATLGALWSVAAVILRGYSTIIVNLCTYFFVSYFMVKICAKNSSFIEIIKGVVSLYGITFTLAGCMHALYYYTWAGYWINSVLLKDEKLLLLLLASIMLLISIFWLYGKQKIYSEKCSVTLVVENKTFTIAGYVDTGNVLLDPYYKKPISVIEKKVLYDNLDAFGEQLLKPEFRLHMVPFRSLGCENGMMQVIQVEKMIIYNGKNIEITDVLIGLTDNKLSSDNEFQILVNSQLL